MKRFQQRDEKEDKMKFQEFKIALRSYEETEKSRTPSQTGEDSVMNCKKNSPPKASVTCYSCGQLGHKSPECRSKDKKNPKKKTTDGAATADRILTIWKYVARKTLQKP